MKNGVHHEIPHPEYFKCYVLFECIDKQELSLKKIYDKTTEGILDMSNVRIFKEIEKKTWGIFIPCYDFGQMSSVKRLA